MVAYRQQTCHETDNANAPAAQALPHRVQGLAKPYTHTLPHPFPVMMPSVAYAMQEW